MKNFMFPRLWLKTMALSLIILVLLYPTYSTQSLQRINAATHLKVINEEKSMKPSEQEALRAMPIKIRERIVTELKKDFELEGERGFQVGLGESIDIWLPLSADSQKQWSNDKAVAIMERVFGTKFSQTFQLQLPTPGDWSPRNDIWFPIPVNSSLEGWSDEEVRALAGQAVMLAWSFIPARFSNETINEESREMLVLSFSVHPGMIFDVD